MYWMFTTDRGVGSFGSLGTFYHLWVVVFSQHWSLSTTFYQKTSHHPLSHKLVVVTLYTLEHCAFVNYRATEKNLGDE